MKFFFNFERVLLATRGCSRTLKTPNYPPLMIFLRYTGCPISSFSPLMCKEKRVNFTLRHSSTTQCALLKTFNTSTYVVKDRIPDCAVQRARCLPMLTWSLPSAVPRWSGTPLQRAAFSRFPAEFQSDSSPVNYLAMYSCPRSSVRSLGITF